MDNVLGTTEIGDRVICEKCAYNVVVTQAWITKMAGQNLQRISLGLLERLECPQCEEFGLYSVFGGVVHIKGILPRSFASQGVCQECGGRSRHYDSCGRGL